MAQLQQHQWRRVQSINRLFSKLMTVGGHAVCGGDRLTSGCIFNPPPSSLFTTDSEPCIRHRRFLFSSQIDRNLLSRSSQAMQGYQEVNPVTRLYGSVREVMTFTTPPSVTPAIESRLDQICNRHSQLVKTLLGNESSSPNLSSQEMAKLNKELSDLETVVQAVEAWREAKAELENLRALASDASEDQAMRELANEEMTVTSEKVSDLQRKLLLSLLPRDAADDRGVVLEVRAGTGGEEASLFAGELFRMYERYSSIQGWKFEVVEFSSSDLGGCKLASVSISGSGSSIYGRLKFESGVHRVQRVPATESGGRVHTSAASVAVLPQAEDVDVDIKDDDIRIDVYRAGGAGGQHVNTTNSAVRVTHIPSGLSVSIQDERSQHKNKAKALKVLRARLFDEQRQRAAAAESSARKQQIGSGDRSERVRTYNFPQGRVTDHRVGLTEHGIDGVMQGERLDVFIDALQLQHQAELLATLGE